MLNYNIGQPQVVNTNKQEVQLAKAINQGQLKIPAPNHPHDITTPGSHSVDSSQLKITFKKYHGKLSSYRSARKGDLKRYQNTLHKYSSINPLTSPPITPKQKIAKNLLGNGNKPSVSLLRHPLPQNSGSASIPR